MKILFNCTTNNIGGGVKNSAIFIKYALEDKNNSYYFAISPQVKEILDKWEIEIKNSYLFDKSPARHQNERMRLYELANQLNVDLVFTMAGPAYVDFKQKHVMGISNPYITHTDFQGLSIGKNFKQLVSTIALVAYQAYFARKADYWIFQTNASRDGFCKRLFIDKQKTTVIPNSIGKEFLDSFNSKDIEYIDTDNKVTLFSPAAAYPHKALSTIPEIAFELKKIVKYDFEFVLTINQESSLYKEIESKMKKLKLENAVRTIGPYNYADAPSLYENSDIIFVPSVLETFSASYLEAFASKKPLIVADKNFARDICGNGAIYIDPFNAEGTASAITALTSNKKLQSDLIIKGNEILKRYGNQEERFEKIKILLENVK